MEDATRLYFLENPQEIRPMIKDLQVLEQEVKANLLQPYVEHLREAMVTLHKKMEELEFPGYVSIRGNAWTGYATILRAESDSEDRIQVALLKD